MTPLNFSLGHMLNDDEKRKKMAASLDISKMPTKEHREIAECLKRPDFSFTILWQVYGKNAVILAMQLANMAAKYEIERRNLRKL